LCPILPEFAWQRETVMPVACALLLFASLIAAGFEILDTTDDEWTAPGYQVTEEAVIDPLDYGEPFLQEGSPAIGLDLSFVGEDSAEAWRVVFVLDEKVVVLQQDEEPVEIPVDLGIEYCRFSSSGRYLVVHDGADQYTGRNAARIDVDTGEVRYFDSQPGGALGPRNMVVSNTGSLLFGWNFFDEDLNPTGRGPDIYRPMAPVSSPNGTYWAATNFGSTVYLLDRSGTSICWTRDAGTTLSSEMVFSPDERLLAVPVHTGLEVWDVATGETVWRDESGKVGSTPIFDRSSHRMWYSNYAFDLPEALLAGSASITIPEYDGAYSHWRLIAASGDLVMIQPERRNPNMRRRALIDTDGVVLWASKAWEIQTGPSGNAFSLAWGGPRTALSRDGSSMLISDGLVIRVFSITEEGD
jgi:hypothetical protein